MPSVFVFLLLCFSLSVSSAESLQLPEENKDIDNGIQMLLDDCDTLAASGQLD